MADKVNQHENVQGEETSTKFSKEELLAEVAQMISKQTNAAITQRLNSFENRQDAVLAEIKSTLASFSPKSKDEGAEKGKAVKEKDPEFFALQKKVEEMQAKEAKLVEQQRDSALRKSLSEQLTKAGIDPKYMKAAIATLVDSDKAVGYTTDEYASDKDKLVFRSKTEGEQDLITGLRSWVKSDEGKSFVAPKGVQGSGDRSYSAGKKAESGAMSNDEFASVLINYRNSAQ